MALASRVATQNATKYILEWRFPYNIFQTLNFSTSSSSTTTTTTSDALKKTNRKKKNKKNLFEVAQFLPNWGVGYHLAKSHWTNVSYEITKLNLYKDGRHGKAWGLAYKDGVPASAPKKISGVHKRCWKYIPKPLKLKLEAGPEPEPEPEPQGHTHPLVA